MTRPFPALVFASALASLACGGLDTPPGGGGGAVGVGDSVTAVRGVSGSPQSATVLEQYGKLARLRFADGETGWVEVDTMDPPGVAPGSAPAGDTCARDLADTVLAPRGTSDAKIQGLVGDTYGEMAYIVFLDEGEMDWAPCDALELVTDPVEVPDPDPEPAPDPAPSGGGGGVSAAVTKCQRACNSGCSGASNKAKCVGQCRRDCAQ